MDLRDLKGNWALVTGASSGIGREFVRQLASCGMNVVLVARREHELNLAASQTSSQYEVRTLVVVCDLSHSGAISALSARLQAEGIKIRVLCNMAAFGKWGEFERAESSSYREMIATNCTAVVTLCEQFLPDLASFSRSVIINASSPAALQPVPYMSVYAATKAFVHNFSLALYEEWKSRGVLVQTLVPGPTATEFDKIAGAYSSALKGRGRVEDVVKISLRAMSTETPLAVAADGIYKQRLFAGLAPTRMVLKTVARMFHPSKNR